MEGRTRWNRSPELRILILLFAAATAMQAVRPAASYRTLELGGTSAAVGLVAASYGALAAIAAVPCGRLIDRLEPRRFLLGGLAVLVASYTLGAAAPTILTLAGSQALVGLGQISTVLAVQTIIANRPDPDRGFARLTIAAGLGQALGPLIAGSLLGLTLQDSLEGRGTKLVFVAAAGIVGLGLAAATLWVGKEQTGLVVTRVRHPASPLNTIVRRSGMSQALATSVVMTVAVDLLIAYLPVVGELRGIEPAIIGILLSLRAMSGLASRMTMTAMLRWMGRRRLLLGAMITSGFAMLGIALVSPVWLIAVLIIVVGFSLGTAAPMTLALVALSAPEGGRGTALAIRVTGNRIGQVIFPVGVAGLANVLGPGAVFIFVAGTLLGGAVWVRGSPLTEAT